MVDNKPNCIPDPCQDDGETDDDIFCTINCEPRIPFPPSNPPGSPPGTPGGKGGSGDSGGDSSGGGDDDDDDDDLRVYARAAKCSCSPPSSSAIFVHKDSLSSAVFFKYSSICYSASPVHDEYGSLYTLEEVENENGIIVAPSESYASCEDCCGYYKLIPCECEDGPTEELYISIEDFNNL